jgi:hypothetical protein
MFFKQLFPPKLVFARVHYPILVVLFAQAFVAKQFVHYLARMINHHVRFGGVPHQPVNFTIGFAKQYQFENVNVKG